MENTITQNALAGIALGHKGGASIKKNRIESNEFDGISVFAEATASIIGNLIRGNGGCGIWAQEGTLVRGWDNKIFENEQGDLCEAVSGLESKSQ